MTTEKFFQEIKGLDSRPCFLLGNGINRYLQDNSLSWADLLMQVADEHDKNSKSKQNEQIKEYLRQKTTDPDIANYPEIYTSILVGTSMHKHNDKIKHKIKSYFKSKIEKSCYLLDYAKANNLQILTTNYDFAIEEKLGFCSANPRTHRTIEDNRNNTYSLFDFFAKNVPARRKCVFEGNGEINDAYVIGEHCAVWHVHGHVNRPKTILIGIEDYIDLIIYIRSKILRGKGNRFAEPWEDGSLATNTWLRPFFTRPLIIAGLTLGSCELPLRWLLLRRARARLDGKCIPQAYYLDSEGETEKTKFRRELFRRMGIEYVSFGNRKNLYENDSWRILAKGIHGKKGIIEIHKENKQHETNSLHIVFPLPSVHPVGCDARDQCLRQVPVAMGWEDRRHLFA